MKNHSPSLCGIICEYNPFHLGHQYHLQKAKETSKADLLVCLLSGPFTQRGSASLLLPKDRAHMALSAGADVVFELPCCYSLREAEHFAYGGVLLLSKLGIDAISFGSESDDLETLKKIASFLNNPQDDFKQILKAYLQKGLSFPKAQSNALNDVLGAKEAQAIASPNNILSVAYLRAIDKLKLTMNVFAVKRLGHYHDCDPAPSALPSATALRSAVYRRDWKQMESMMPPDSFEVLGKALFHQCYHLPDALDLPLLYRLRGLTPKDLMGPFLLEPGLDHKIITSASKAATRKELVMTIKSKRYTYARINRTLSQIMLNMTGKKLAQAEENTPLRLLGFKKKAQPWLNGLNDLFYTKGAAVSPSPSFLLDMDAYDLWALGAGMPKGLGYRQSPIII